MFKLDFLRSSKGDKAKAGALSLGDLAAVLDHMVVPTFVLDRDGRVALWNKACEELTGLQARTVLGAKEHWRGFYTAARPCLADLVFNKTEGQAGALYATQGGTSREGRRRAQNWCDLPKGARRYLTIDAGPIHAPDGTIAFVVETLHDQTEIKQIEAALDAQRQSVTQDFAAIRNALGPALARLAEGDLDAAVTAELPSEADALRKDFNVAGGKLRDAVAGMVSTGQAIEGEVADLVAALTELSHQGQRQRGEVAGAASALDSITSTVRANAEAAEGARHASSQAKSEAEKSGVIVDQAVEAIHAIEQSSRSIGQIIGVIDEIAFQTNLLALNAGVEAARAGEAGRGFAVVASEVRALAQRSAEAAKEIKTLVGQSGAQVSRGVELVASAGEALKLISSSVAAISLSIGEIAERSMAQADGLQDVNQSTAAIAAGFAQTFDGVERSTASAQALAHASQALSRAAASFRFRDPAEGQTPRNPSAGERWRRSA